MPIQSALSDSIPIATDDAEFGLHSLLQVHDQFEKKLFVTFCDQFDFKPYPQPTGSLTPSSDLRLPLN